MTLSNKKLSQPTTYGTHMSTVTNTDGKNPPTTSSSRAFKRFARDWEKTCAAIIMKKHRVPTVDTMVRMTKRMDVLLPPASLS
jgi:hypothetical protein